MAMVDEIADLLENELPTFGIVGASIFTHHMPPTPDEAFSVHQFPLGPPVITMTRTIAESVGLQIQCRASSRQTAEENCYRAFNLLHQVVNTDIDGEKVNGAVLGTTRYLGMFIKKSPQPLKIDSDGRSVFYCEFSVMKELSGLLS